MTKLPSLKANDLLNALEKAGFQIVRQRGSHVRMSDPKLLRPNDPTTLEINEMNEMNETNQTNEINQIGQIST